MTIRIERGTAKKITVLADTAADKGATAQIWLLKKDGTQKLYASLIQGQSIELGPFINIVDFNIVRTGGHSGSVTVQNSADDFSTPVSMLGNNGIVSQSQGGTGSNVGSGLYTAINNVAPRSLLSKIQAIATPALIASPRSVFTDTALSTSALNGQAVAGMIDISGNGIVISQGTAANCPLLRSYGFNNSLPALDYGSSTAKRMTATGLFASQAGFSAGFTAYTVAACPTVPAATRVLGWGLNGNNYFGILNDGTVKFTLNGVNGGFIPDLTDLSGVYVCAWDGVNGTVGINGRYFSAAAAGSVPVTGDYTIANLAAGGFGWSSGPLGDTLVFPGVHTQAQMDAISALLNRDTGLPLPVVFAIGTSLTVGQGTATPGTMNHAAQTFAAIGGNASNALYKNFGLGGTTLAAMITDVSFAPRNRTGYVSTARGTKNTMLLEGGTNDMSGSGLDQNADVVLASLDTLLGLYENDSTNIFVQTVSVRGVGNAGVNFETRRLAYNDGLPAILAKHKNCYIVDVGGPNSLLGQVASLTNTAIYQGDQIHWTLQGQSIASAIETAAIAAVTASPMSGDPINVRLAPRGVSDGFNRSTAQTAAIASIADYTVGAVDESFDVSVNVNVTASVTHSIGITCAYTDETNTARILSFDFLQLVGTRVVLITNVTGVGPYSSQPQHIRCKAGTRIVIASAGTFTSVTYNAEAVINKVT